MASLLYDLANGKLPALADDAAIAAKPNIAKDLQTRLQDFWLLDAPDGKWGRRSSFALRTYKQFQKITEPGIGSVTAKSLINTNPPNLIPGFKLNGDWASRTVMWMTLNNYHISTDGKKGEINIVYFRGLDRNGNWNGNPPFVFNDRRTILVIKDGVPSFIGNWLATCDPGQKWWENPMNEKGCADIKATQFRAWSVGHHHEQLALVQSDNLTVLRGSGREPDTGDDFGVNQHTTGDDVGGDRDNYSDYSPGDEVGGWSAGCQVGASAWEHFKEFMPLVQADPREQKAPGAYKHWTTIIDGEDFLAAFPAR